MKKLLLTLMLAVVSSGAMAAEWVEIGETDKETTEAYASTFYADPDTIRKTGNRVKMWVLVDYKKDEEEFGILSARLKEEYDCKEKKQRILFTAFYSGHMADGGTVLVYSEPEARWQQHLTGSVANIVLEYACSFRPQLPQTIPDIIFS